MSTTKIFRLTATLLTLSVCWGFLTTRRSSSSTLGSLMLVPSDSITTKTAGPTTSSSSTSSSPFTATISIDEDKSFEEYSRCLSPQEEYDQINSELGLKSNAPKWKKLVSRKSLRRVVKAGKRLVGLNHEYVKQPGTLILVRSGESEFSKNYTFTGWADPDLVQEGQLQMEHCSRLLYEAGYADIVDVVYTSRLKRAIKSTWIILQEISAPFIPIYKSWRLNERHYGSLTGLCKNEAAKKIGTDVVQAWRRSLKARPPPISKNDTFYPGNDSKYVDLLAEQIPRSESLADCMSRTKPLWDFKIKRDLQNGKNVMVVAHANTIRGIVKIIDGIDDDDITDITFPKGIPFVYKFDSYMNTIEPNDTKLKQIHTNGTFLENPMLLQKALDVSKLWDRQVPGPSEGDLPKVAKRVTTLEQELLKLHEGTDDWETINNDKTLLTEKISIDTHRNGESDESERFEEDLNPTSSPSQDVEVNWNYNNNDDGPVVVFVRHGRTPHNNLKLFTGWQDPPLATEGVEDARVAGRLLKQHGFHFDVVYSSWLFRAIQTAWFILEEMDLLWIPLIQSWRLNERHYGDLSGKSKKMVANIYGEDQLKKWRRGYKVRPPPVSSYSFNYPGNDKRRTKYVSDLRISVTETFCRSVENRKLVIHRKFPKSESLKDCMDRSIPFYTQRIVPEAVAQNKRVLITSHENAIRGILMELCEIPENCMNDLHLPNGIPLIYNVKRKCISLLDDGSNEDPLEKYDFGSAAQYLFRPCEINEDDF